MKIGKIVILIFFPDSSEDDTTVIKKEKKVDSKNPLRQSVRIYFFIPSVLFIKRDFWRKIEIFELEFGTQF